VEADAVALETSTTTLSTAVAAQTVQDLPINGRDYVQMIGLTLGFAGYAAGASGSVNGARANQVNWQIEGTDNNDQWWNIMAVNQGGINSIPGVLMPLDALEEFSLQTQAGPESGRNPGGTINLVVKSGTNQLHGSGYYYNRNEALASQSPFAPVGTPKNKLRNEHYGMSLGGPIIKDKTFFFLTYEEQKFTIGIQALATTPTTAYQQEAQQLLTMRCGPPTRLWDLDRQTISSHRFRKSVSAIMVWPRSTTASTTATGCRSSGMWGRACRSHPSVRMSPTITR